MQINKIIENKIKIKAENKRMENNRENLKDQKFIVKNINTFDQALTECKLRRQNKKGRQCVNKKMKEGINLLIPWALKDYSDHTTKNSVPPNLITW